MAGELPIALETVVEAIDDQADARTATKSREETGPAGIGGPADGHATPLIIGCTLNCVKQASRIKVLLCAGKPTGTYSRRSLSAGNR